MRKSEIEYTASVAQIRNRVAVPRYYFDELPKYLRQMSFTVSNLETLRQIQIVQRSLQNATDEGLSFEQWKDVLDTEILESLSQARLETVYRTNIGSVYGQSTRYNAVTSEVTPYLMYSATGDDRTRESHLKLDGVVKRADSKFWDKYLPSWDYNCTSFNQSVSGRFTKAYRGIYGGRMYRIVLDNGNIIRGLTPNHPVMTDFGFVFAKNIQQGDNLFVNQTEVERFDASWNVNQNDRATARNVFKAMRLKARRFFSSSSIYFYGDIRSMDKNIDVVSINEFLAGDDKVFRKESQGLKLNIASCGFGAVSFKGICSSVFSAFSLVKKIFNVRLAHSNKRRNLSRSLFMLGMELIDPIINAFNIFSERFLLSPVSSFDSYKAKPTSDRVSTDSELLAKFQNASALKESTSKVVKVDSYFYFGFVYDFESVHGLVLADGILTSNCRCDAVPLSTEDAKEIGITRGTPTVEEDGFGVRTLGGDMMGGLTKDVDQAIASLPKNSPYKTKFEEAQENISSLVDIWFEKNKHLFE